MKIEQNRIDDLNLELSLTVAKEDYAENKKKRLNEYRKKAEFKGFRKGMVPMSLVEKMYGGNALVDSVNDIIAEALNNFIKENNLKVLGEPLPSEDTPHNVWEDGNDFSFKFDLLPWAPAQRSTEPIDAAIPVQMVATSGSMICMVS